MHKDDRSQPVPSEALFRALVQNSSDMISLLDAQGSIVYQSPSIERLLGYRPEDRIGHNVFSDPIVHPDDRSAQQEFVEKVRNTPGTPVTSQFRLRHADGSWRDFEIVGQNFLHDSAVAGIVVNCRDITERKGAEESLRERERQLDSLMGHLPGLAYRALADEHWTALFASKGVEDLTGYSADEFTSHHLHYDDIMLPEDRQMTREAVFTALRERRMYEVEHRIRHKDGSIRWIWARGHGVFAPDGSLRFIEGLNLDMTRQKQAEEALRESEQRFRGTFENAAIGIVHSDSAGRFLRVN